MQLVLGSWGWMTVFCLMLGAAYAWLLYSPKIKTRSHQIMAILRFLSVSLLSFFLLSPILIYKKNRIEGSKIIMIMDNSESVGNTSKKQFYNSEFKKQWFDFKQSLGKDFEVSYLNFGGDLKAEDSFSFNEKKTNISQIFDYVNNTYNKQNVGAVIIATDGLYNRGSNPLYKQFKSQNALYCIGLGDSTQKKDALVKEVNANAIAYLNNEFPLEIIIAAKGFQNGLSNLTVSSEGIVLHSEKVAINNAQYFKTINVKIAAKKPGAMHLIINLSSLEGEVTFKNNRKDVFIDVIDGREKILIAYNSAHPDIGALKECINSNQNYEANALPISEIKLTDLAQYKVAILHQLPSRTSNSLPVLTTLKNNKTNLFYIIGTQSNIEQYNTLLAAAKVERGQGRFNESQAIYNASFNTFLLETETQNNLNNFPPLKTPYGFYPPADNSQTMAFQKIGSVPTKSPILSFYNNTEKAAVLYGEGFWKWRINDFAENGSFLASTEIINKTIQYLSVKDDKRKFRVYPSQNIFEEDQSIKFYAEYYNASYELINDKDINLTLTNADNKTYSYTFGKSGKSYALDLGVLNAGIYKYEGKASGENDKISGKIIINPLQNELLNTTADFAFLRELANKNNGQFFNDNALESLKQTILKNKSIGNVSKLEKSIQELINLKLLFFLIVILLGIEWFIRKYEGGY